MQKIISEFEWWTFVTDFSDNEEKILGFEKRPRL